MLLRHVPAHWSHRLTSRRNTKPGGWCEFQDFDIDYYSQDGTLTEEHALRRWLTILTGGLEKLRRRMDPGKFLEQWFKEAGFVNVQAIKTPLPLGPWPKDKKLVSRTVSALGPWPRCAVP